MLRSRIAPLVIALLACLASSGAPLDAGLQDFVLVNHTGYPIYELYYSESAANSWGRDMLGDDVLENGESLRSSIEGSQECYWDFKAVFENGATRIWTEIDLCAVWKIQLRCNANGCWADFE